MQQVAAPVGTPVTDVAEISHSVLRLRRVTWLPVPAYVALIAILYIALPRNLAASLVFDPPVLMLVLNTVFLFGISFAVFTTASRAYLASGSSNILLLGCGVLALGGAALAGGWVRPLGGTANSSVTIHNLGVLLGSILHCMSALLTLLKVEPEQIVERRRQKLLVGFAGTLIVIALIIASTIRGVVPLFWTANVGSTPIKQAVLGTAVTLFALTSIYTMVLYFQIRRYFLYWYSLALALTAIGLIGITVMKAVGDPIGWAGRTAQYLGGVYFLIAALSALRDAKRQGVTLEAAIDRFYHRSEVHYRDLVDTVSDAIISVDDRKRVLLWNQGAEKMLGYTSGEAAGCLVSDLLMPEGHKERLDDELLGLQRENAGPFAAKGLEIDMRRKDGTLFPSDTSLSIRRIGLGWMATLVIRDITERKQSEQALLHAKQDWERTFDAVPDLIAILDDHHRILRANQSMAQRLGLAPEQCVGKICHKVVHGLDCPPDFCPHTLTLADGREHAAEVHEDCLGGDFLISTTPLSNEQGRYIGSVHVARDVTQRKLREERIARLTKLYAVLSRVNETIVRTHDEEPLYSEVCRIVAEEGEFPLVWVGQVREKQVAPVAWHGPAADYLKEIKVEVEGELGRGPTGTCIREDRSVINDDFDINPFTAPWRKPALNYGFRASAAFPLRRQGRVVGALTLYAPEPGTFNAERVKLLESLCADISYALDAIQQEKLRLEAEQTLRTSETRSKLLSETAGRLLATDDPQGIVNELCRDVMAYLDCQAFFNFLVDREAGRLHLNACAGIPEEEARKIEWLDYGVAVCGCDAQEGHRIVAEDILNTPNIRTELVKSYGIQAYACHLLMVQGRLIGTLSFGTKTRPNFTPGELALMRMVTDQVATAMERMRLLKELQRSRDELEIRVQERTRELEVINENLKTENEERLKVEIELRESENHLRYLSTELLNAQEKERKRVAQEIHDSMGASLAAAKFKVEATLSEVGGSNPQTRVALESVIPIIQGTIEEARRIQMALRPSILDDLGILPTIKWFCREFESIYSNIRIRQEIDIEEDQVPDSLKTVIYRVLQEALNNIAKHSKASAVLLSLQKTDLGIELAIRDNGQGFTPEEAHSRTGTSQGLGLESMEERTELAGGSFSIESSKGAGTVIQASWPVEGKIPK